MRREVRVAQRLGRLRDARLAYHIPSRGLPVANWSITGDSEGVPFLVAYCHNRRYCMNIHGEVEMVSREQDLLSLLRRIVMSGSAIRGGRVREFHTICHTVDGGDDEIGTGLMRKLRKEGPPRLCRK